MTAAAGGGGISGASVDIYDSGGNFITSVSTGSAVTYTAVGMTPPATGYTLCFDASNATGGGSTTGYESRCHINVPWRRMGSPGQAELVRPLSSWNADRMVNMGAMRVTGA